MDNFSGYSDIFAVMISKMSLSEIVKLAETSKEILEKIRKITITATDKQIIGAVTPYNMYRKYENPQINELIRKKIIAENNVELFKKYFEVDPEPILTIIELLKMHNERNDIIEYILTLDAPDTGYTGIHWRKIKSYDNIIYTLSLFLKNSYYSSAKFEKKPKKIGYLLKYKSVLGYISDEFYTSEQRIENDPHVCFTESYWQKNPNFSFLRYYYGGFMIDLVEYNLDRSISFEIYKQTLRKNTYVCKYFAQVKFWKTDYGRQLFEEYYIVDKSSGKSKLIRKILKYTYHPFDLSAEYPHIFTESLILDMCSECTSLAKSVMRQRPELLTDSAGYLLSKYVKTFSDGSFPKNLKINDEDVIKYVCDSIDDNDDDIVHEENMILFLLRENNSDICKKNENCMNMIFQSLARGFSPLVEVDPEIIVSVLNKLGIDYERLYNSMKTNVQNSGDDDSIELAFAIWDRKIRGVLSKI